MWGHRSARALIFTPAFIQRKITSNTVQCQRQKYRLNGSTGLKETPDMDLSLYFLPQADKTTQKFVSPALECHTFFSTLHVLFLLI